MQSKLSGSAVSDLLNRAPMLDRVAAIQMDANDVTDGKPDTVSINDDSAAGSTPVSLNQTVVIMKTDVEDDDGQLKEWVSFARNTFHRHDKLVVDPSSATGLADLFSETTIGKLKGTEGGTGPFVGVHYSCGMAGEASARPHLRVPPFREGHCNRMVKGSLLAAGAADNFPPGHLFVMTDGKAHSNNDKMQKCFSDSNHKALPKQKKILYVMTTEDSERDTKERMSGVATLATMEINTLFSQKTISVPYKKRLHCGGSNVSDTLGPLHKPARSELWSIKQSLKSKYYGSALVEVGGKVDGDAGGDTDPAPRSTELVPFCWHSKPTEYYDELMHAYNIISWWDLTASDTILLMMAVRRKFPYLGVCHTHDHAESLEEECIERIFKAMQDPSDALFESRLAELMKPTADECPQTPKAAPGAQPPRGSADRKPQGKAAAKATAKASASAASILQKLQALDDGELGDE